MESLAPLTTEANTDSDCENGTFWESTSILIRSKYDRVTGSVRSACRRTISMMWLTSGESTSRPIFWPCRNSPVMEADRTLAPISSVWFGFNRGPAPVLTSSTAARPKVFDDMKFAVVSAASALRLARLEFHRDLLPVVSGGLQRFHRSDRQAAELHLRARRQALTELLGHHGQRERVVVAAGTQPVERGSRDTKHNRSNQAHGSVTSADWAFALLGPEILAWATPISGCPRCCPRTTASAPCRRRPR